METAVDSFMPYHSTSAAGGGAGDEEPEEPLPNGPADRNPDVGTGTGTEDNWTLDSPAVAGGHTGRGGETPGEEGDTVDLNATDLNATDDVNDPPYHPGTKVIV